MAWKGFSRPSSRDPGHHPEACKYHLDLATELKECPLQSSPSAKELEQLRLTSIRIASS